MNEPKRTEPTRSLLQGAPYTNANNTDIRVRFERIRQQAQPPQKCRRVK